MWNDQSRLISCMIAKRLIVSLRTGVFAMFASLRRPARHAAPALLLVLFLAACGVPAAPALRPTLSPAPVLAATVGAEQLVVTTTNGPNPKRPADVARHKQLVAAFHELRPDVTVDAHVGDFNKDLFAAKLAD